MKRVWVPFLFFFLFFTSDLVAFNLDLYGRTGLLKVTHPSFEDEKFGMEFDIGGSFSLIDSVAFELRAGYGYVLVEPINVDDEGASTDFLTTFPLVASVIISPFYFLPIINPYIIAELGIWAVDDPINGAFQGVGGGIGLGISFKGGCLGFDLRVLSEKPDLNSTYNDVYISFAPVLYIGF